MSVQIYATPQGRINKIKGEILAHAIPCEVFSITGSQKKIPMHKGDTVIFRRFLPYGGVDNRWITADNVASFAQSHQLSEGVTPAADTLQVVDVPATVLQYGALYAYTDKVADLYEDDIPSEMTRQLGERITAVREMVIFGALKSCTNQWFAGGTTIGTVSTTISLNAVRQVCRNLWQNHAKEVTKILDPSENFNTAPVEAAYLVFCHSDLEPDIRGLPGFVKTAEYGTRKVVSQNELGSCERFRFIISPELAQMKDAGALVGSTGCMSTTGTNIDVYQVVIVGEDAWGTVALRGKDSVEPTVLPPGQKDKNDPLGQRGYIGATYWMTSLVLNPGWMAILNVGASSISF